MSLRSQKNYHDFIKIEDTLLIRAYPEDINAEPNIKRTVQIRKRLNRMIRGGFKLLEGRA